MAKNINPSRMRMRLEFGKYESSGKINPNTGEAMDDAFNPHFTKWAGKWTLSQTQALTLAGANIKDAIVFFVRHSDQITSDLYIRWKGKIFTIDSISYDDGLDSNGFDLITCHQEVTNHA